MYNEKIEDFLFALTFRLRSNAILHMSRTRSIVFGLPESTDLEAVTFQGDACVDKYYCYNWGIRNTNVWRKGDLGRWLSRRLRCGIVPPVFSMKITSYRVPAETSFDIIRAWFRQEEVSFSKSQIKFCTMES